MNKFITLNPNPNPKEVLTFNSTTGEVQYALKENIATPTVVTATKPAGNPIANLNGTIINETLTTISKPTLDPVTNILSIKYKGEDGVEKVETVDLSALALDIKVATTTYDAATKLITITNSDGTIAGTIDVSTFVNPNQKADQLTIVGTGSDTDPFKLKFATRAELEAGTDTDSPVNVLEVRNQIQENEYKSYKTTSSDTADTTIYKATSTTPILALVDQQRFYIIADKANTKRSEVTIETPDLTDPINTAPSYETIYTDFAVKLNIDNTGDKFVYKKTPTGTAKVANGDIVKGVSYTYFYDKTLDAYVVEDLQIVIPNDSSMMMSKVDSGAIEFRPIGQPTLNLQRQLVLPTIIQLSTATPSELTVDDFLPIYDNSGKKDRKITINDLKTLIVTPPKKHYEVKALIAGTNLVTHNLTLIAPFATIVQLRDPLTGATVNGAIKNRTANTYEIISNIATTVEITSM